MSVFGALYQRTFNRDQVARQCAPDIATVEFIRLANELELDVQPVELTSIERLDRAAPVAVQMRRSHADGAPGNGDALEWCVVLQTDAERVLLSVPGKSAPETMMRGEFQQRVETQALRVRNKMPAADDPDVPLKQQFGFSWFVPELLKHRAIWRDVLTASLALQLIALAFPLFTQAVIDKVVVHRTSSTLVVLAVGMAVFVVFTGVLTWVRQSLVSDTFHSRISWLSLLPVFGSAAASENS